MPTKTIAVLPEITPTHRPAPRTPMEDDVVVSFEYRPPESMLPPRNTRPWLPPLRRRSGDHTDRDARLLRDGPLPMAELEALLMRRLKEET